MLQITDTRVRRTNLSIPAAAQLSNPRQHPLWLSILSVIAEALLLLTPGLFLFGLAKFSRMTFVPCLVLYHKVAKSLSQQIMTREIVLESLLSVILVFYSCYLNRVTAISCSRLFSC